MNLFEMTVLSTAGVAADSDVASVVSTRANIIEMTLDAEDAVLRPKSFGGFEHELRAAIAARVANLAGEEALAGHYVTDAGQYAPLAEPENSGSALGMNAVLAFVDKVANHTSDASEDDILRLQAAGISDADIVRLCELVAFLAYQIRVISGLRLMQKVAA